VTKFFYSISESWSQDDEVGIATGYGRVSQIFTSRHTKQDAEIVMAHHQSFRERFYH
jgi:hypothetical protein